MKHQCAVDLDWDVASQFFDDVITASSLTPKLLWAYTKGAAKDWKKSIVWQEVRKDRISKSMLLDATRGFQVRQNSFYNQLFAWVSGRGLRWSGADVESAVFGFALRWLTFVMPSETS